MADIPDIRFRDGTTIPQVGFGVFKIPDDEVEAAVSTALELGYRHIDTASAYGNERGVGVALAASGLPRDEVFVTTKLSRDHTGRDNSFAEFDRSRDQLQLDAVDLVLTHWPVASHGRSLVTRA